MTTSPHHASTGDFADDDRQRSGSGLLPFLLRAAVPVALITLIVGYVAYTRSAERTPVYSATAQVVLSSATNFSPVDGGGGGNPDRYVENQAEIMTTVDVLNRAALVLNDGIPGTELRGKISADPLGPSDVINVTAEAEDPGLAARRADAVGTAYALFTTEQVNLLADQAAAASASDPTAVLEIRARAATFGDGVQVIQPATVPTEASSPTPERDAYLAAAAAFLLSAGLAVSWRSRRRPTGPDQLAADAGGPLLGEVPVRALPSATPTQPGRAVYTMALQAIRYRLREGSSPTILLTDVGRGSSATSAALGLASAAAAQGRSVLLLDANPDGRLLHRTGVPAATVPIESLGQGGDLERALPRVPSLGSPSGGLVRVGYVNGAVVAADDVLQRFLAPVLDSVDVVVIDAGSLQGNPAAFGLLGQVGAVVAVVRGTRGGKDLRDFRRQLALTGRECAGVLVTRRAWLPSSEREVSGPDPGVADRTATPPLPPVLKRDPGATEPTVTAGRSS
ncbi:Capsular polysaccharide biosynthesis protein [Geodermatophilus dictyosporus]|uniref:Capsular polysaccharide biosynthesis protein n=1 Tax=Geodermatophilus dictyosporus TaxID=1523247 RepID=A0A1I5MXC4_9ACTN|nr:hypothetical protein [Geodermatophilus dictyosporus]SFP14285.1 Capsular polysaccharide biosynthesis protein [Geodermatophilus dictyosporus]